jgi:hypothetical protein
VQGTSLGKTVTQACLTTPCTLLTGKDIQATALIDSGADSLAFIDEEFVKTHAIPTQPLLTPITLRMFNGEIASTGDITHQVTGSLQLDDHHEELTFLVTKLSKDPIILGIAWLKKHDVQINWKTEKIQFKSSYCQKYCRTAPDIDIVDAQTYISLSEEPENRLFAASIEDIKKALQPKKETDPLTILPEEYHEFQDVFSQREANTLPQHRPYDHTIQLKEASKLPFSRLYPMSRDELQVLRKYLDDNLKKGFIQASSSPTAAPVLFVKKPNGGLRLCVDYRALNALTVKNQYPLPLIRETLLRLSKAKYFTKLDIISAFNRIRIKEGDEYLTAFRTRYGLFESLVMPFGLTGAPSTFQHYINDVLREHLDVFCTAYLDDILIYSTSLKEHQEHVKKVLQALQNAGLQADIDKCEFHTTETKYLGLIITTKGVQMDPKKIETVKNWATPTGLKDVQAFLGFANFYRRFIREFSGIVRPLTALTKKNTPFYWSNECQNAFDELKNHFISAPILKWFNPEAEITVETDASDYVSGGIMSQPDSEGILHPLAYFSKKHSVEECNYEIYDKELLAIVRAFEEWRPELEGAKYPVKVITDHRNLEYFMSTKNLNRRQARWSEFLSRFNFKITYRPGRQGAKPDSLTRRSEDLPREGDQRLTHQSQVVLKPENLDISLNATSQENALEEDNEITELFKQAYENDPIPNQILNDLRIKKQHSKLISLAECSEADSLLYYRERKYVPDYLPLKLYLLKQYHDSPTAGHPGRAKTLEILARDYYWPDIYLFVKKYTRNCKTCARSKPSNQARHGVLKTLSIPERPWTEIAMDFIVGLPESEGFNSILTVIDRLTGLKHLIPCNDTTGSEELAWLYLKEVWRLHGLPLSIVSDRGPQFISRFWRALCERLGIKANLSTAYHPQTDGKTERANAITEQYLRSFVSYQQDDWVKWLPLAEFTYNGTYSESIKMSPFFANYAFNPRLGIEPIKPGDRHPQEFNADKLVEHFNDVHQTLKTELHQAQAHQELYANKTRTPAPKYQVGDLVWLSSKNITSQRPSHKLDWKKLGPYPVEKIVSPYAYKLALPPSVKIWPVFHVSLLTPAHNDPYLGQHEDPPPPVIVNGQEEYEVLTLLDSRRVGRGIQYLVKWQGYDTPTWEPLQHLQHLPELLTRFHVLHPQRPQPKRL